MHFNSDQSTYSWTSSIRLYSLTNFTQQTSNPIAMASPKLFTRLPLRPLRTFTPTLRTFRPIQPVAPFHSSPSTSATYNQVMRGCRKPQPPRKKISPALVDRPHMKGVCLRVGITKPKKPNSGERKTCRVRLSNGKEVSAYIGGEGHNVQQHSVVLLRGGELNSSCSTYSCCA